MSALEGPHYGVHKHLADKFKCTVRNATLDPPVSTVSLSSTARGLIRLLLSVGFVFWFFYVVSSGRPNLTSAVYQETVSLQTFFYALFIAYGIHLVAARKLPDWTPLGWSALALVALTVWLPRHRPTGD